MSRRQALAGSSTESVFAVRNAMSNSHDSSFDATWLGMRDQQEDTLVTLQMLPDGLMMLFRREHINKNAPPPKGKLLTKLQWLADLKAHSVPRIPGCFVIVTPQRTFNTVTLSLFFVCRPVLGQLWW